MLAQAVYLLSLVDPSLAANTVSPGGVTLLLLIDFDLKIVSQFYFHLMFSFEADCDELSKKVFGRVAAQVCGQWSPNATRLDYRCAKLGGNSALPPYFQMGSLSQLRYAAVCLSM